MLTRLNLQLYKHILDVFEFHPSLMDVIEVFVSALFFEDADAFFDAFDFCLLFYDISSRIANNIPRYFLIVHYYFAAISNCSYLTQASSSCRPEILQVNPPSSLGLECLQRRQAGGSGGLSQHAVFLKQVLHRQSSG